MARKNMASKKCLALRLDDSPLAEDYGKLNAAPTPFVLIVAHERVSRSQYVTD